MAAHLEGVNGTQVEKHFTRKICECMLMKLTPWDQTKMSHWLGSFYIQIIICITVTKYLSKKSHKLVKSVNCKIEHLFKIKGGKRDQASFIEKRESDLIWFEKINQKVSSTVTSKQNFPIRFLNIKAKAKRKRIISIFRYSHISIILISFISYFLTY